MTESVTITVQDGSFSAYMATPAEIRGPGIVVIQEIFGVNIVMREICDAFAAEGYVAICPDLFWRQEPDVKLTDKTEAEWQKAFALFNGFDVAKGIEDLAATLDHLRTLPGFNGKAGCVGFCLGGKLAFLMATRTSVDCAVGYYGVGIEQDLAEAQGLKTPLMLHIAELDKFCPPETQAQIIEALSPEPNVTLYTYPGCDHAFGRVGGEHYDPAAAARAGERTTAFFKTHLPFAGEPA